MTPFWEWAANVKRIANFNNVRQETPVPKFDLS